MPPSRSPFSSPLTRGLERLEDRDVPAVAFHFDYSLDNSGFFNDPSRRASLDQAAARLTSHFNDDLAAITPTARNTWTPSFFNPITGSTVTLPNLTLDQGEIRVYINAGALGGDELGLTNSGGFSASGTPDWLNTVRGRGQAGALETVKSDFSTWGGMISFDARANWNFGSGGPSASQYDFQSVTTHELMHVLGFGLGEAAFTHYISGGRLNGPQVRAVTGGAGAAVVGDPADHFAPGTVSDGQASPMQPSLPPGVRRLATPLDYAALDDIGWDLGGQASPPVSPPASPPVAAVAVRPQTQAAPTPVASPVVASPVQAAPAVPPAPAPVARPVAALGGATEARLISIDGGTARAIAPFGPGYANGVRVAVGDLTGDGIPDLAVGTGPGVSAEVRVYNGASGNFLSSVRPFEAAFTGGVNLALGDLTGDGRADLVITPDVTGGPVVSVYDGASLAAGTPGQLGHFWGLNDPSYRGGLRPALGDLNGDGVADLALAAGAGGGPRVAILDGTAVRANRASSLAPDFFAFDPASRGGAAVAFVDADGDGRLDLVTGSGTGGAPRVTAFSGGDLLRGTRRAVADFTVGDGASRTGVRLASADLDGDGRPDLVASSGGGASVYKSAAGLPFARSLSVAGLDEAGAANVG